MFLLVMLICVVSKVFWLNMLIKNANNSLETVNAVKRCSSYLFMETLGLMATGFKGAASALVSLDCL